MTSIEQLWSMKNDQVLRLQAALSNRIEDVRWLLMERLGEPPLAPGEQAHDWQNAAPASRHITPIAEDVLKLSMRVCSHCQQLYVYA